MQNGFIVRFRFKSFSFSMTVDGGCVHLTRVFSQATHAFEYSRYRFSALNSAWTALSGTHPLNLFYISYLSGYERFKQLFKQYWNFGLPL